MRSQIGFIIILSFYFILEVYLFFGVKSFLHAKKSRFIKSVKWLYIICTLAAIISLILMIILKGKVFGYWMTMAVGVFIINLLTKIALMPYVLIDDIRRLGLFTKKKLTKSENTISRSAFLQKAGLLTASVPLVALSTGIAIGGAYRYKVHRKKLAFSNLPSAFNGLKIVQISDIHSGSFYNKEAVKKGVDMLMDLKPDVVFFTGDIVNERAEEMDEYFEVFNKITAPMGVYSILGNHDYGDYYDWDTNEERNLNFEAVKKIHKKLGWQLLLDEHIYLEKDSEKIAVLGVENWGKGFHKIGDLRKAYNNCNSDFKILLSHDPTHWEEEVTKDYLDIDLTLSGHTHGAQMGIETHNFKWSPIQLRYSRWAGLYSKNNQKLYINRGFGFLGYPGRIGIWPEITLLELGQEA